MENDNITTIQFFLKCSDYNKLRRNIKENQKALVLLLDFIYIDNTLLHYILSM